MPWMLTDPKRPSVSDVRDEIIPEQKFSSGAIQEYATPSLPMPRVTAFLFWRISVNHPDAVKPEDSGEAYAWPVNPKPNCITT